MPAASINPVSVPAGTVEMRCAGLMLALSKRAANTDGAEDIEQMTTQAFLLLLAGASYEDPGNRLGPSGRRDLRLRAGL